LRFEASTRPAAVRNERPYTLESSDEKFASMTKLDDLEPEHAIAVSGEAVWLIQELSVPTVAAQFQRLVRLRSGQIRSPAQNHRHLAL
jgi:hypothetical protein